MVQDVKSSQEYSVNAGDSVLGPTLFLLYINNLPDDVTCNIVCTPFFLLGGVEPPAKFPKSGGLIGSQFLEGGLLGKRE